MSDLLALIQWPAMGLTVLASWLEGSTHRHCRLYGFWTFLASNAIWSVWGWHTHAWALITLQGCLAVMNVRGIFKLDAPR